MCNVLSRILIHALALLLYRPSVSLSLLSICCKPAGRRRDEVDSLALRSPELSRNGENMILHKYTACVFIVPREGGDWGAQLEELATRPLQRSELFEATHKSVFLGKSNHRRAEKESAYSYVK